MKFKNLAFFSIFTIVLMNGCGNKEKIDDKVTVNKTDMKEIQKQVESNNKEVSEEIKKEEIPEFYLKTTSQKVIKVIANKEKGWIFEGYKNKVILLDFFGTWCPPCKAEIPHLNNIREELKSDFEIIGIDIGPRGGGENSPEHLAEFIKEFSITYPLTSGEENNKLFDAVRELNPQGSIPFMVLFNKKGEYMKHYIGMTPQEMLTRDIKSTIKMK